MILANIAMIFISFGVAKIFAQILKIPYHILGTFIMMLAIVGCYAYQGNMMDVYIMIFGGIFGYFFKKYKFNTSALILALVLGPMLEKNFRRGMGSPTTFWPRSSAAHHDGLMACRRHVRLCHL
jgi:putative tricarboxylic transport membrane protein